MKHTIILLALLAVSVGCTRTNNKQLDDSPAFKGTFVLDGCTYIHYDRSITHSGTCPNPIHYSDTCCKHK